MSKKTHRSAMYSLTETGKARRVDRARRTVGGGQVLCLAVTHHRRDPAYRHQSLPGIGGEVGESKPPGR